MPNRLLTLEQAARHIHMDVNEVRHLTQRGEIEFRTRGDEIFIVHGSLDEWAQRNIFDLSPKNLTRIHRTAVIERHLPEEDEKLVERLTKPEWIDCGLESRTRPGVIRDMVALALKTELLYDDVILQREIEERERLASTAIGEGAAFLHTRYVDPYFAAQSFFVVGRTKQPIYYGAPDGQTTDIFFLICCVDDSLHLHLLARLCLMMHGTDLPQQLRDATSGEEAYAALLEAERQLLPQIS